MWLPSLVSWAAPPTVAIGYTRSMEGQNPKITPRKRRAIEQFFEEKQRRASQGTGNRAGASANSRAPKRHASSWSGREEDEPAAFEPMRRRFRPLPVPARSNDLAIARVLQSLGQGFIVSASGRTLSARAAPRLMMDGTSALIVAGDEVRVSALSEQLLRIEAVEPRRSAFGRYAESTQSAFDPIAANIDLVLMVCTPASPPFRARLVDRFIIAAAVQELPIAICLNKADLGISPETDMMLEGYASLGIEVVRTSTLTGEGMDALTRLLEGRTTLLAGHSGVGKSTLLNRIEPGLSLAAGAVTHTRAGLGKGTHTTTSARLLPLSSPETYVVDSPGIRAFGLGRVPADELLAGFPEIEASAARCAARRCQHTGEDGCAVADELIATPFGRSRLASYRSLLAGEG
jgi:ribosome biogenesis GTPase